MAEFRPWIIERFKQHRADAIIPVMNLDLVREAHCVPRCLFPQAEDGFMASGDVFQDYERKWSLNLTPLESKER